MLTKKQKWTIEKLQAKAIEPPQFQDIVKTREELFDIIRNSMSVENTEIFNNRKERILSIDKINHYNYKNTYVLAKEVDQEIDTCILLAGLTHNDAYDVIGPYEKIKI